MSRANRAVNESCCGVHTQQIEQQQQQQHLHSENSHRRRYHPCIMNYFAGDNLTI